MNNVNKSLTIVSQLLGLLIGIGFQTPIEITVKNYPEYRILN